jgi:hypothetical protein
MDKENMGHIHNGVLFSHEEVQDYIIIFRKMEGTGLIILRKISQGQKVKCHTSLSYAESRFKLIMMMLIMLKVIIIITLEHEYKRETVRGIQTRRRGKERVFGG